MAAAKEELRKLTENKKSLTKKSKSGKADKSDKASKAIESVMKIGEQMMKKIDEDAEKEAKTPKAVPIG